MRSADSLDGYLLRVLCTVVDERSVSRAATRLDQTQPAISAALKRLREILGDPLLVREKMGMVPTARAMQFAAQAKIALAEINKLLAEPEVFEAQSARRTFRVATPDYLAAFFLADVARRLRKEAPQCRLEVHPLGADFDFESALAQDRLDVVIGNWPHPPEQLHTSLVLEDEVVCLVSSAHPFVLGGLSEAGYLAAAHVVPMPYSMAQRGVVETYLAERKVTRDARVVVPYFGLAPYLVAETDMVFTTARHFAEHYARLLPLAILPAPMDFPRMRFYQLWHQRAHHSAAHRWLRGVIQERGRSLAAQRGQPMNARSS